MNEALIKKHMETLGCTRDEAISLIMEDEETDKMSVGEINKELTPDQKKAIKDNTKTTSGKKKSTEPRERKVDEEKLRLIEIVRSALFQNEIYCEVANAEREVNFNLNGADYTFTLTKHRAKK